MLNTGHIGYSLEQYDQTLRALGERFQPHYVVISVSQNDIAQVDDASSWSEGGYWLDSIVEQCQQHGWRFLIVPSAEEFELLGPWTLNGFQGKFRKIVRYGGQNCVDPGQSFTDALLRLKNQDARHGEPTYDPLFNLHLMGDRHYSPLGADVWARVVCRRLLLVWDGLALAGVHSPEPVVTHARSAHPSIPGDDPDE